MKDVDEKIDVEEAIRKAGLTERQHTILMLWLVGHTHGEIAQIMGTKRAAVTRQLGRITKRISEFM